MGLDGYFYRKKWGDTKFELRRPLCGGIFSGNGEDGSFRARRYNPIVIDLTGYDLSTEYSNEEIKVIAKLLREAYENRRDEVMNLLKEYDIDEDEFLALVELFEQAAEKGCVYTPWG